MKYDIDKLKNNGVFCILPWMSAYVNTDSTVWSCCVNKAMTDGDVRAKMKEENSDWVADKSIISNDLENIINDNHFKQLRLDMLNGVENQNCFDCINLEKNTGHSYRKDFNFDFEDELYRVQDTQEDGTIKDFDVIYLDFRFSNVCNFKCRSCRPEWSSTWAKEASDNDEHPYTDWDGYIPRYNLTQDEFISKFEGSLSKVKKIYFAGGEPLAAREHYWILDYLIKNNNTNVLIDYNTNLSMLKNPKLKLSVVDYWEKFENISLRVSIDGMGKKAEYIRKGTNWQVIEDNFKYISDKTLENIFIIPLTGPLHLSSQVLPNEVKDLVVKRWDEFKEKNKWLLANSEHGSFMSSVTRSIQHMNSEELYETHKTEFEKFTSYLDKIRKESFSDIFPELKKYYEC
jgi:organic radical activating enzyme